MVWTTPTTKTSGATVAADPDYNLHIIGNINYLHAAAETSLSNASGGTLALGDVLVQSSDTAVNTTTTADTTLPVLVATQAIGIGVGGNFAAAGFAFVNVNGAVTAGQYLQTSTTAKKAKGTTTAGAGTFGRAVTSSSTQVYAKLGEMGGGSLTDHNHTATGDGGKLTSPRVVTSVKDTNGNPLLGVSAIASAVNYLNLANAATGGVVSLQAAGSDTDVSVQLASQNAGTVKVLTGASLTQRFLFDGLGNLVCGAGALATNATDGFLYAPSSAGTPTGTPSSYTGRVPFEVDTINERVYFRIGSNWRYVRVGATGDPDAGGGGTGWQLDGNTVGSAKWFGTVDNYPIEFKTNGITRFLLYEGTASQSQVVTRGTKGRPGHVLQVNDLGGTGEENAFAWENYEASGAHRTRQMQIAAVSEASYGAYMRIGLNTGSGQGDTAGGDYTTDCWQLSSAGKVAAGDLSAGFAAYLAIRKDVAGGNVDALIENTNNASGTANALVKIMSGGTSGGDSALWWAVPSTTDWQMGIDNSDGDMLKICRGNTIPGTTAEVSFDVNDNIGFWGASFGGGGKVLFLGNAATTPTSTPSGGGVLYVSAGALRYRGSSGTDVQVAAA